MKKSLLFVIAGFMALTSAIPIKAVEIQSDYLVKTLVASGISGCGVAMGFNKMVARGLSTNVATLCTLGLGAVAATIRCSLMSDIPHNPYSAIGSAAALLAFFATV